MKNINQESLDFGVQEYPLNPGSHIVVVWREGLPEPNDFIVELLKQLPDYTFLLAPQQKPLGNLSYLRMENLSQIRLILALGGDGTFLRAHRLFSETLPKVPILGINYGQVGFLTCFESSQIQDLIDGLKKGRLLVACRPKIRAEIYISGKKVDHFDAVNDVVIERGDWSQLLPLEIHNDDNLIAQAKADAIVISTALGSTAYNLAGGGPLLHPDCHAWCATFIAPHSLSVRPMVLPMHSIYLLKLGLTGQRQSSSGYLVIDGQKCAKMTHQHSVLISLSPNPLMIARRGPYDEIRLWHQKLGFGFSHT